MIKLKSLSISLTFKCWVSNGVVLVMIVMILNLISDWIAHKSDTYKRYVMLFWRNNLLSWHFCVLILYFFWKTFPNKYFQKWEVWKKYKKGTWPYRQLSIEKMVQSFYTLWIYNHVFLWLLLPGILFIFQIGSK